MIMHVILLLVSTEVSTSLVHRPAPLEGQVLPATGRPSLPEMVERWLDSTRSPHTRRAYRRDFEDFALWCSGRGLDPLTVRRGDVDRHVSEMGDTSDGRKAPAASTVARRLAVLSSFYKYAVSEEWVERNPVERVRRPAVSRDDSATAGLTRDEARRLLDAAATDGPRAQALVTLLLLNGLRVSEALDADVTHLGSDRGHRILRITGKGGTAANVPLAPATVAALDAYLAGRTVGPLFATRTGGRLDQPAAFRLIRRLATRAGLANAGRLSPHSLRHTAITVALDAGVPLRDVQDFARHADPRTTRRYDRARHSLDRNATYAVAGFLAPSAQ
jgi:integrase/recombinase XerD